MKVVIFLTGHAGSGKTTVAEEMSRLLDGATVVEVDDIKVQRYGTTEECRPSEDFPEAGRLAGLALAGHDRVIVVEAFGDDAHIAYVQNALPPDAKTIKVLLKCHPGEALKRQQGVLSNEAVTNQLARFQGMQFSERRVIDTSNVAVDEVAQRIVDFVRTLNE